MKGEGEEKVDGEGEGEGEKQFKKNKLDDEDIFNEVKNS